MRLSSPRRSRTRPRRGRAQARRTRLPGRRRAPGDAPVAVKCAPRRSRRPRRGPPAARPRGNDLGPTPPAAQLRIALSLRLDHGCSPAIWRGAAGRCRARRRSAHATGFRSPTSAVSFARPPGGRHRRHPGVPAAHGDRRARAGSTVLSRFFRRPFPRLRRPPPAARFHAPTGRPTIPGQPAPVRERRGRTEHAARRPARPTCRTARSARTTLSPPTTSSRCAQKVSTAPGRRSRSSPSSASRRASTRPATT